MRCRCHCQEKGYALSKLLQAFLVGEAVGRVNTSLAPGGMPVVYFQAFPLRCQQVCQGPINFGVVMFRLPAHAECSGSSYRVFNKIAADQPCSTLRVCALATQASGAKRFAATSILDLKRLAGDAGNMQAWAWACRACTFRDLQFACANSRAHRSGQSQDKLARLLSPALPT